MNARVWIALAAWLVTGCAGPGFHWDDLPTDTLAFVFRTPEEAEKMDEWFKSTAARLSDGNAQTLGSYEGFRKTFRIEDIGQFVGLGERDEVQAMSMLGRLAFVSTVHRDIEVVNFARRGARPIDWSKDHTKLLFADQRVRGEFHLYEWDRENGQVTQMTWGDGSELGGCYAADGSLVFARTKDGLARIWRRPRKGRPAPITPGPADAEPDCSPVSSQIVYTTRADGRLQIASIDPVEGEPSLLGPGRGPVFTPDGSTIVYSSKTRKGWRLRRMRADGSNKRALGGSGKEENDPAVSPDGKYVVYVAEQGRRQALYVRDMETGGDRPIVLEGDALLPVW